ALKRKFNKNELRIVVEACRSWDPHAVSSAAELTQLISAQCETDLLHLKHGVSRSLLEAKLSQLSDSQSLSLLVWASSFWNNQDVSTASLDAYVAHA
ncbi:MAG: hypothetical protein IKX79_01400, partial [Desulfovibrionaceae bacterium]|nr:hypothetical protein [Desulfovibrionaceae bacterium]